jgi:hypothetical protein
MTVFLLYDCIFALGPYLFAFCKLALLESTGLCFPSPLGGGGNTKRIPNNTAESKKILWVLLASKTLKSKMDLIYFILNYFVFLVFY